jgi:branched-chain amino acid transport system permease protein
MLVSRGQPLWTAILGAIVAGALAGASIDRIASWPARVWPRGALGSNRTIVASFAALALSAAVIARYALPTRMPAIAPFHVGRFVVDEHATLLTGCVLALVAGMWMLGATRLGTAIRAVADNPTAARAAGIDVEWTITQAAMWGSMTAAVAGIAVAMSANYFLGLPAVFAVALSALAAAALGGLRSIPGTLAGAYVVAAAQAAWVLLLPHFVPNPSLVFIVILASFALLPRGLLSRPPVRSS